MELKGRTYESGHPCQLPTIKTRGCAHPESGTVEQWKSTVKQKRVGKILSYLKKSEKTNPTHHQIVSTFH